MDEDHEDGNTIVPGAKDTDIDPESLHFGFDRADFEGLKRAIFSSDQNEEEEVMNVEPTEKSNPSEDQETGTSLDDSEIQKLEGMMQKLQAVRDISAGLPEDQRKRMAARAVNEVMKDL